MVLGDHLPRPGNQTPDLPALSRKVLSIRPPRMKANKEIQYLLRALTRHHESPIRHQSPEQQKGCNEKGIQIDVPNHRIDTRATGKQILSILSCSGVWSALDRRSSMTREVASVNKVADVLNARISFVLLT